MEKYYLLTGSIIAIVCALFSLIEKKRENRSSSMKNSLNIFPF